MSLHSALHIMTIFISIHSFPPLNNVWDTLLCLSTGRASGPHQVNEFAKVSWLESVEAGFEPEASDSSVHFIPPHLPLKTEADILSCGSLVNETAFTQGVLGPLLVTTTLRTGQHNQNNQSVDSLLSSGLNTPGLFSPEEDLLKVYRARKSRYIYYLCPVVLRDFWEKWLT